MGAGRRFIRQVLQDNRRDDLCEAAELVISEVVTNALVHAGTDVHIAARVGRDGVRVEVSDGSPHLPTTKNYADLAATGRGLQLLEQMVDRWGVDPHAEGKTVWFELGPPRGCPRDGRRWSSTTPRFPRARTTAWSSSCSAYRCSCTRPGRCRQSRCCGSTSSPGSTTTTAPTRSSGTQPPPTRWLCSRSSCPPRGLDDNPDALMAAAVEPYVSAERVVLSVPSSSVPHFSLLHEILETATAMADAGTLLTPPTQPEVQCLRQWLCSEVVEQSDGRSPEPWDVDVEDATPPRNPARWDPSIVTDAAGAMLAADDTNRILAVSPAALALLGYDDHSELIHRRLVEIIPRRYRQAHLAGFTLHLFAGRSPLLSTTVVVPALRRDGSEVTVQLRVTAHRLPEGRKAFVAELTEPPR